MIANVLPEIHGVLPLVFVGLLLLLAGAVGVFSLYVIVQQFRNPGRGR